MLGELFLGNATFEVGKQKSYGVAVGVNGSKDLAASAECLVLGPFPIAAVDRIRGTRNTTLIARCSLVCRRFNLGQI